jgi:hypothetical protein
MLLLFIGRILEWGSIALFEKKIFFEFSLPLVTPECGIPLPDISTYPIIRGLGNPEDNPELGFYLFVDDVVVKTPNL